jgi:hypothetical protein
LREELALPDSDVGPEDFCEFSWFARICAGVAI